MSFTRIEGLGPSRQHAEVAAKSDSDDLLHPGLGFIGTTAGAVKVDTVGGELGVVVPVAAGVPIPIAVKRIWSTGTTAGAVVVFW